jgi:hypothetical protein
VRDLLSKRTDIKLVPVNEARWALQMTILDRQQTIVAVDDCTNTGNPTVGSGAFLCTTIHPEIFNENTSLPTSFNQPSVSPSQESISLVVSVRAIDLNNGQVMWAKLYNGQVPPVVFNEIGDTGDRITMTQLQNMPDLHAMRYQEVVESAVQTYSQAIAADIENLVFTSFPR